MGAGQARWGAGGRDPVGSARKELVSVPAMRALHALVFITGAAGSCWEPGCRDRGDGRQLPRHCPLALEGAGPGRDSGQLGWESDAWCPSEAQVGLGQVAEHGGSRGRGPERVGGCGCARALSSHLHQGSHVVRTLGPASGQMASSGHSVSTSSGTWLKHQGLSFPICTRG